MCVIMTVDNPRHGLNCVGPSAPAELQQRSPPSLISLAGGAPNPNTFPFQSAIVTVKGGDAVVLDEPLMKRALQYSGSYGYRSTHTDACFALVFS